MGRDGWAGRHQPQGVGEKDPRDSDTSRRSRKSRQARRKPKSATRATRIKKTRSGEMPRVVANTAAEPKTQSRRPRGGSSPCSNTRTVPVHHRQMPAAISRPLGFTIPPRYTAVGVSAQRNPTRSSLFRDHVSITMMARPSSADDMSALTCLM
jgi:hypothetical protein